MRVARNDAARHDQHADRIGLADHRTQRVGPCWASGSRVEIESEGESNLSCGLQGVALHSRRADELEHTLAGQPRMLAEPVLPLLAGVDHFEQVGAGAPDLEACQRAEVGDRQRLVGWRRQEQKTHRHMRGLGKVFCLF